MSNLARDFESDFDLEEFEYQIRKDERMKIYRQQHRKLMRMKQLLIQKFMGAALIVGSIVMLKAGWFYEPSIQGNDGTCLLIIIPLGLFLIFTNERDIE